jgi:hypothetical protein
VTRLVEILVAASAICAIAGFLGVRAAVRKTLRTLGRKPDEPRGYIEEGEEGEQDGDRGGEASDRDRTYRGTRAW